jgi:hypothetical protein
MEQKKTKKNNEEKPKQPIDRKEAIRKTGYIALSAATMMILLSKPDKAVASSPSPPPTWP